MRELIRTPDGIISQVEFRSGAKMLLALTLGVIAFLYGVGQLSHSMEWMTVAIAPFFGVVVIFVVCSLIYFWYCIFTKRLRAVGRSPLLIQAWLATMFLASGFRLMDYQNRTLGLFDTGILVYSGFIALVLSILAIILFAGLLWTGWTAHNSTKAV